MDAICNKCGAKTDGTFNGFNPCHERSPIQDHAFLPAVSTVQGMTTDN